MDLMLGPHYKDVHAAFEGSINAHMFIAERPIMKSVIEDNPEFLVSIIRIMCKSHAVAGESEEKVK